MDHATCEEVQRLRAVLPVANVRCLNANHLDHRLEDGCPDICTCGEPDDNDRATRANILCSLLEWFLVGGDEDDGVWAQAIFGSGSDVLDDIA